MPVKSLIFFLIMGVWCYFMSYSVSPLPPSYPELLRCWLVSPGSWPFSVGRGLAEASGPLRPSRGWWRQAK